MNTSSREKRQTKLEHYVSQLDWQFSFVSVWKPFQFYLNHLIQVNLSRKKTVIKYNITINKSPEYNIYQTNVQRKHHDDVDTQFALSYNKQPSPHEKQSRKPRGPWPTLHLRNPETISIPCSQQKNASCGQFVKLPTATSHIQSQYAFSSQWHRTRAKTEKSIITWPFMCPKMFR